MSARKSITVTRAFRHEPGNCARALALLLQAPVRKEAAHPAAPKDDVKELDGYVANPNYSK